MVLLAIPLGLGAGAIDVALNHYVALHYSAKQMSFLHCTYLVEYKKMTAEQAAGVVLFYFIGMAVGRFLSGIAADKLHSWKIIMLGESVLGIAVLLLAIPGPALLSAIGLFMIGLGNGPLFPNFNYLAPESFGKDVSESVISLQMAAAYVGILVGPLLCGLLGQNVGMFIFPLYIICAFSVMTGVTISVRRLLKKRKTARNAIPIFIIGSMKMYVFQCCLRMVPPSAGCGSPVEISAEGRSTDRAGRRERLTEPRYGVRVVPTNPFMPKWESRDKKTTGDSP